MSDGVQKKLISIQAKYYHLQHSLVKHLCFSKNCDDAKASSLPILDRSALEDLSLNGNIWQYLGDEYVAMKKFKQRLRMPAPPFLCVSSITACTLTPTNDELASLEFEFDIPKDTPFQSKHGVHDFILAESCHALAFLAYFVLKEVLLQAPSGLRGSNGSVEFFSDSPAPGDTIQGQIKILSIINTAAGKLLKQVYHCYHKGLLIFTLQNYSAVIDPSRQVNQVVPMPKPFENLMKVIDGKQLDLFYQGQYADCFEYKGVENINQPICHEMNRLLHAVHYFQCDDDQSYGGAVGLFQLTPKHWVFKSHFVDDALFPASLMSFAIFQLMLIYAVATGFYVPSSGALPRQKRHTKLERKLINPILPSLQTIYFRIENVVMNEHPIKNMMAKAVVYSDELVFAEFYSYAIEFKDISYE